MLRLTPILLALILVGCNPGDARDIAQDTGKLAKTTAKAAGNAGHVRNVEDTKRVLETVEGIRGVEKVIDKLNVKT